VITKYTPGKTVEIKGADDNTRSFDLNDRDSMVKLESGVKVGTKVKVTVHQEKDQPEHISIAPTS
jgi:hypothetical protein